MNSLEAAKTTGSRLLAILAVLMLATGITACGGGGGGGGSGTPTTGTFRFVNNSGVTISDLYLWEASQGTTRQGPDQLGTNVLVHGATFDVTKVPCKKGMYFRAQAVDSSWWTDVRQSLRLRNSHASRL